MAAVLKFAPASGAVDASFFSELGQRKLHEYKLSDAPVEVQASFSRADRQVRRPLLHTRFLFLPTLRALALPEKTSTY